MIKYSSRKFVQKYFQISGKDLFLKKKTIFRAGEFDVRTQFMQDRSANIIAIALYEANDKWYLFAGRWILLFFFQIKHITQFFLKILENKWISTHKSLSFLKPEKIQFLTNWKISDAMALFMSTRKALLHRLSSGRNTPRRFPACTRTTKAAFCWADPGTILLWFGLWITRIPLPW